MPLRVERRVDEIAGALADASAGADDAGVVTLVAEQLAELDRGIDGASGRESRKLSIEDKRGGKVG